MIPFTARRFPILVCAVSMKGDSQLLMELDLDNLSPTVSTEPVLPLSLLAIMLFEKISFKPNLCFITATRNIAPKIMNKRTVAMKVIPSDKALRWLNISKSLLKLTRPLVSLVCLCRACFRMLLIS